MVQLGNGSRGRSWLLVIVALFGIIGLATSRPVQASETGSCLKMAMPEVARNRMNLDLYRQVMAKAGLCVDPVWMPNERTVLSINSGEVDGVFARLEDFNTIVDVPVVHGSVVVAKVPGFLVVREPEIHQVSDLTNQTVGVWLGSRWTKKIISDYPNVVRVPGGAKMLQNMLRKGRLDAVMMDGFSLAITGGVPDGFHTIKVETLIVYTWVRQEFSGSLPKLDAGTRAYRKFLQDVRDGAS